MRISARKISFISLLIAMSIVLTRLASIRIAIGGIEGIRIGFGKLPIILSGIMFGPVSGGIVGSLSDIIGYLIQPMGPYLPHFTVISALSGALPPILLYLLRNSNYHYILKIVIIITITIITTDLFLVPYTLNLIFHIPIQILIFPRLVSAPVTIIIYTYILHIFNRRKVINIKYLENQSY